MPTVDWIQRLVIVEDSQVRDFHLLETCVRPETRELVEALNGLHL
jgi:hypothetical protein